MVSIRKGREVEIISARSKLPRRRAEAEAANPAPKVSINGNGEVNPG
jgi:hypothetical protein